MLVAPSVGSYWPQFLIVGEFAGAEIKICRGSPEVASPCEPLPSLLIKCPWGQNWPSPGGSQVEHRNKEQIFYNSSSLELDGLEV